MRELHGVLFTGDLRLKLKRRSLLFDKFHIWGTSTLITPPELAELDFLRANQVVIDLKIRRDDIIDDIDEFQLAKEIRYLNGIGVLNKHFGEHMEILLQDTITRIVTAKFVNGEAFDRVPIYQFHPPDELCTKRDDLGGQALRTVIKVTLCGLPTPDENCAWEDILEFRAEGYEKRWGFRRFLHTLATKSQTEAEIRDDLEWTLKDYTNAMHIHHIKASQSFFEVYLLPVIELVEDLAKFNWSKLPKAPST